MKSKKTSVILILLLVAALVLSFKYVKLRFQYNDLKSRAKSDFARNINEAVNYVDIDKINTGGKDSICPMINMHESLNKAYADAYVFFDDGFVLVAPADLQAYQSTLDEILNKAASGKLTDEDASKIKMMNEDMKLIYKYVNSNDNITMKKYSSELRPQLRVVNINKQE